MQVPGITPSTDDQDITGGTGAWETLTLTYTHTADPTTKRLQFLAEGGSAEFYVDSVSVVTRGEIDVKGDMELPDPNSGWSDVGSPTTPSARSSQQVDSGTYSRSVVADSAGQGIENDTPFTLIDDQSYTLRARVYVVDDVGSETVRMRLVNGSDQPIPGTSAISKFTGRWETLSCVYRPNGNQTGVQLQFLAEGGAASFFVDTVAVRLLRELADPVTGVLNGDMETDGGWSSYNSPSTNAQSVRVDSGAYFRHVQADTGQGIESAAFTLEEEHTYLLMARLYLVTDKAVKMTVTGGTSFDAVTLTGPEDIGRWQTLRAIHQVTAGEAGSQQLRFLAQAAGAEFYVDTVHLVDLGIISEALQDQVRWQEFAYDTRGRTLAEYAISPVDAAVIQATTRRYEALGNGSGLLQQVVQTDLDGQNDVPPPTAMTARGGSSKRSRTRPLAAAKRPIPSTTRPETCWRRSATTAGHPGTASDRPGSRTGTMPVLWRTTASRLMFTIRWVAAWRPPPTLARASPGRRGPCMTPWGGRCGPSTTTSRMARPIRRIGNGSTASGKMAAVTPSRMAATTPRTPSPTPNTMRLARFVCARMYWAM
jgi:hypothetical protein